MPVTKLKQATRQEFLDLFDQSIRHRINDLIDIMPGVTHVVCFENLALDSSECGHRTALIVGPGCTYKTLDDVREAHLGDMPSRFQYPTHYVEKDGAR